MARKGLLTILVRVVPASTGTSAVAGCSGSGCPYRRRMLECRGALRRRVMVRDVAAAHRVAKVSGAPELRRAASR